MPSKNPLTSAPLFVVLAIFFFLNVVLVAVAYFIWRG